MGNGIGSVNVDNFRATAPATGSLYGAGIYSPNGVKMKNHQFIGYAGAAVRADGVNFASSEDYDLAWRDGRRLYGTTAQRPAAATGATYFDTTLHKPIWREGAVWRDATNTMV